MEKYEALHMRAHDLYVAEQWKREAGDWLWELLDNTFLCWKRERSALPFWEYLKEHGYPERKWTSRFVFLNSTYHMASWAGNNLSGEDLALWAEEHGLHLPTLQLQYGD